MTSRRGPGNEFRLPDVGEGLEQAEIVEWLVAAGDTVARDQPLVEILTDKSQTQLPSPKAGVIARLGFAEGDIVEVGQVLVEFGPNSGEDSAPEDSAPEDSAGANEDHSAAASALPAPFTPVSAPAPAGRRPKASPAVRRRALEAGIELTSIDGTGPGGRITIDDFGRAVASAATAKAPSPPLGAATSERIVAPRPQPNATLGQMSPGRHQLRGIRRVTAEAMTRALAIPHIHGADEFDATALLSGRRRIKELQPERAAHLTPLAFFVMAVADGLRRFPMVNASIDMGPANAGSGTTGAGHIDVHDTVNIGIAVATEAGLVVPVIKDADLQTLFDLADEIHRLTSSARDRTISATDMQGGTCTVTNYGSLGGRFATPMIRPPEASIVGFGSIRERPIVIDGAVVARPTLPISIAVDHRLIDGDVMTAFQEHIIGLLTDPVALLAR